MIIILLPLYSGYLLFMLIIWHKARYSKGIYLEHKNYYFLFHVEWKRKGEKGSHEEEENPKASYFIIYPYNVGMQIRNNTRREKSQ